MGLSAYDHLEDDSVRIAHHILAIDIAPFITARRMAQVADLPVVDPAAAIPVLMAHVPAPLPVVMVDIFVAMVPIAMLLLIVVVVLGNNCRCKGEG